MKKKYTEEECRLICEQAQKNVMKDEWKKHIDFIKRWVGKELPFSELDNAVNWYVRIFGENL